MQQVLDDFPGPVDRNGEADALPLGVDGDVDADDFALDVQQGPATVSRVDGRVRLDEIGKRAPGFLRWHRAAKGGDDAGGDGTGEPERIADGDDGLTDHQVGGRADRRRGEVPGLDTKHGQVAVGVDADQLRRHLRAVLQVDGDARGAFDDMVVRDDDAVGRPDEAGAEGLRGVGALPAAEEAERIEERVGLAPADGGLGLDVDDSRQDAVRDENDGRPPRRADRGREGGRRCRLRPSNRLRFRGRLARQAGDEEEDADA